MSVKVHILMPAQNLRGVWRSVDVRAHFGIRNTALGIQELKDDDEQNQETGGGSLKHGTGEGEEKTPLETWIHTFNHFTHSCKSKQHSRILSFLTLPSPG